MATIQRFEDLEVWQSSMKLAREVYSLTLGDLFSRDFGLKDQIRRSAVSVPSNIAEGFERDAKKQFLYFLTIAKGSCGELRTQLRLAHDLGYFEQDKYEILNNECVSVSKQLGGFINYLTKKK